jgi:hypothetical protein
MQDKITTKVNVKVKLSLCFNWAPRHEGVLGEWMYSSTHSLTSALDGSEWSASRPGRFTPRERAPCTHWIGDWVGPRAVLDAVVKRKIPSPRRETNPRTPIVQPVAQRYTNWAITALNHNKRTDNKSLKIWSLDTWKWRRQSSFLYKSWCFRGEWTWCSLLGLSAALGVLAREDYIKIKFLFAIKLRAEKIREIFATIQFRIFYIPVSHLTVKIKTYKAIF